MKRNFKSMSVKEKWESIKVILGWTGKEQERREYKKIDFTVK